MFYASNYHPSESGYFLLDCPTYNTKSTKLSNDSATRNLGREEALLLEKGFYTAYHMCLAIVGNVDILKKILEDKRFLIDDEDFDLLNDDLIGSYLQSKSKETFNTR